MTKTRKTKPEPKKAPEYKLLLFIREKCAVSAAAKPQVEKAAAELRLPLESLDALSHEADHLIMGFNVLEIPTLVAVKDGHKWLEFTGAKELTTKHIKERVMKQLAKEAA